MLGSNVLDIGIGLVFTYLSLSLVVTAAMELVATYLNWRAKDLEIGICNLLNGKSNSPISPAQELWNQFFPGKPNLGGRANSFFAHQLVNGLSNPGDKPSYISSDTFATVLLHLVRQMTPAGQNLPVDADFARIRQAIEDIGTNQPDHPLKEALLALLDRASADITDHITALKKFSAAIETWYDHSMDRITGWYKRRTQVWLLLIGFLMAFSLNVDSIAIYSELAHNDALRNTIVKAAEEYAAAQDKPDAAPAGAPGATAAKPDVPATRPDAPTTKPDAPAGKPNAVATAPHAQQHKPNDVPGTNHAGSQPKSPDLLEQTIRVQKSMDGLQGLGIPLGWETKTWNELWQGGWLVWSSKIFGLLLTGLAMTLGAPFWFDVLKMFISIRGAGKVPEKKGKVAQKAPAAT